ncbi:Protein of unknown function [Paracoccus aminovorans]|uniref:DUF1116 domain-containing protein n=1 Tax=Paracoccus aminovorans TaxID=34004 RepID=A0A1I2ZRJ6_9RHOB|nr:DUF1116 domain-containing protein [Paracoccus aminovorans]CQR84110.1 hypothetical protein JCM7685_pAMV3p0165 [Paracoccus aminovorans]SFH40512.1 Protein of unknown function [Paracoccus aminovorans]
MSQPTPNERAFRRMNRVDPVWSAMRPLGSLPGLDRRVVLHAGPAHGPLADIPAAVCNSLVNVVLREAWAADEPAALDLLRTGAVAVEPAQDHRVFVPLAGAAGPSTMLVEVSDQAGGGAAYSPLNEGMRLCTRLGIRDPGLVAHLRWLDQVLAPWIAERLAQAPLPLFAVLRAAMARQDDCHSRTVAGSELLVAALLQRRPAAPGDAAVLDFLRDAPAFALNVWMAMCGLIAAAAEGVPGATLVTRAGGNGRRFGFCLAGEPKHWHCVPASRLRGDVEPRFADSAPLPALGDSAIVDLMGLGGQALATATPVREAMAAHLPDDVLTRPAGFLHGVLDGFAAPAATDAAKVRAGGKGPVILLGMIDADGRHGRVGGGCVVTSAAEFTPGRDGAPAA